MSRPDRSTKSGQVYLDLQRCAREQSRPTDELLTLYALEGFLDRLCRSPRSSDLILKGGVLLAAYAARRPTRDVDIAAIAQANDPGEVLDLVVEIASIDVDDGLAFDVASATAEVIRDQDQYQGVRVNLGFQLATARSRVHVDVNFGDPIYPAPETVSLPRLLGGNICVSGYPLAMVLAEKLVTAVSLRVVNTRWRDYGDVYLLSRTHPVKGSEFQTALRGVAAHRDVELQSLSAALTGYAAIGQTKYWNWVKKQKLDDRLPTSFAELLSAVITFADPALEGAVGRATWDPVSFAWRPREGDSCSTT